MVKDLELQTVNVWTHPALSLTSCVTSGFNFLSLGFPTCTMGLMMTPTAEVRTRMKRGNACPDLTVLFGRWG